MLSSGSRVAPFECRHQATNAALLTELGLFSAIPRQRNPGALFRATTRAWQPPSSLERLSPERQTVGCSSGRFLGAGILGDFGREGEGA
jgi:hypothetical protein